MTPARRALPAPTEEVEMRMCAQYLDARGACWFHVPNGGHRHPAVAAKLKAQGVKRGVCDIWILDPPPGRFGLVGTVIELKRASGVPSDVDPEQRDWLAKAKARCWSAHVANGFDQMRAIYDDLYGRA